ncbi:MAG: hypothetical protein WA734_18840, partial [Candidatus Acidiferrales bacterium]
MVAARWTLGSVGVANSGLPASSTPKDAGKMPAPRLQWRRRRRLKQAAFFDVEVLIYERGCE